MVDALIERVIFAKSCSELVVATRALDRVLLVERLHVVLQFTDDKVRVARLDRFGRPDPLPRVWWRGLPNGLVVGSRKCCQNREAKTSPRQITPQVNFGAF